MTLDLILSIMDGSIQLANKLVGAMDETQKKAFLDRHEARMQRFEALIDKIQHVIPTKPESPVTSR